MALVKIGRVCEVPPESVMEARVGDRYFAICHSGGRVTALDGLCPHHYGPLGQGNIANGRVVCPWHMWEFDCRSGAWDRNPGCVVATYPVTIEDGEIWIEVAELPESEEMGSRSSDGETA
jgi:nitrite reductase (NADH) small subunit